MSYDDLAFGGLGRSDRKAATVTVDCPICEDSMTVPATTIFVSQFSGLRSVRCPECQRILPVPAAAAGAGDSKDSKEDVTAADAGGGGGGGGANNDMMRALFETLSIAGPEFIDFPAFDGSAAAAGGNANMAAMMRAQRGVNIDDLIQSLLSQSSSNVPPTSEAFIKTLKPEPIAIRDFIQVLVMVDGLKRELIATTPDSFGAKIADKHNLNGDGIQVQSRGRLVVCDPVEGSAPIANSERLADAFVLMKRGKIPFVEKARAAVKAGAKGLLVLQTDDIWPYQMTDATRSGTNLTLPCVMISAKDGAVVQSILNGTYTDVKTDHKQITTTTTTSTSATAASATGTTSAASPASNAALAVVAAALASVAATTAAATTATAAAPATATTPAASTSTAAVNSPPASTVPSAAVNYSLTASTNVALTDDSKKSAPAAAAAATATPTPSNGSGVIEVRVLTRERKLCCCICRDDYQPNVSVAIKLPCHHFYCNDCIQPWLAKRNTCPLCRFELPTDKPKPVKPNAPRVENPAVVQLRADMFN